MPVVSASLGVKGSKVFYKNYKRVRVASMARLLEIARTCSLSSYVYGDGVTDTENAEECEGHRSGKSVAGAGDVLLFDFDNAGMTLDMLVERLSGCSAFIGPSKSWAEDVDKFHVGVQLDRELPLDNAEFTLWYRAVAQWLGLVHYDPCMEAWVQQLAPCWRKDGPALAYDGAALDMDAVLAAYIAEDAEVGGRGGVGVAGVVEDDAVFKLSAGLEELNVDEMRELVLREGKQRVHCKDGIQHDDRFDTAFVSAMDGSVYYHCSGGRCGQTLILAEAPGFVEEVEEVVAVGDTPVTLAAWVAQARAMVENNATYAMCYTPEGNDTLRETAGVWAAGSVLRRMGVHMIEDAMMRFDGRMWVPVMTGANDLQSYINKVFKACGFAQLAHSPTRVPRAVKMLPGELPTMEIEAMPFDALNLQNGVYVLGKGLCKHDPRYMFRSILPYAYDADAVCPTWELIANRVMTGSPELVRALQDAMGYLMLSQFNLEKLICFVGEGENGKSTVNRVLKALAGAENCSFQRLHMLTKSGGEGAYARASLSGKLINITEELSPKALEAEMFKDLISGQNIDARWPYGRPFVLSRVPKQVASTNTTNRLSQERSHGYHRRLHLIPFNYRLQEADKIADLDDLLAGELPGILNWVMVGAARVKKVQRLSQAQAMESLLNEVKRDSNSTQQFREEWLEDVPVPADSAAVLAAVTHVGKLYEAYVEYCVDNGYKPLGRNGFSRELARLGLVKENKTVRIGSKMVKASGFYVRILPEGQRREPGEYDDKPNLTVVT